MKEEQYISVSRRDFFKLSGSGLAAATLGLNLALVEAKAEKLAIRYAKETTTICPYCAVGCGIVVHTQGGEVINSEGDSDHPINEGALCAKGSSIYQLRHNHSYSCPLLKFLHMTVSLAFYIIN